MLRFMDTAFLDEIARANLFHSVMQTSGCTYICLWSYLQEPNCLIFLDGSYHEENNQPSTSSGSLARRLFDEYCHQLIFPIAEYDRVPGLAFKNDREYIELNESELQTLASNEAQRLFYQEARIKTAVFMACKSGEIEIGLSRATQVKNPTPKYLPSLMIFDIESASFSKFSYFCSSYLNDQISMEMQMRNLFQKDLSQQQPPASELPLPPPDPCRPSSSSSSLRSLSIDSPGPSEYSSLLFNISSTSQMPETLIDVPSLQPLMIPNTNTSTPSPHHQAIQAFSQLQNIQVPTQEIEHAAMTRAILAVLTSSSSSSSSSQQSQQSRPPRYPPSAFKHYNLALAPTSQMTTSSSNVRAQSMLKRAISYYRRLNIARREYAAATSRPTSNQLHHMISERKRREKLNESFQALRSLLPPGTKKDKASLLISTREYLSSLKAQIDELSRRNQILEAQLLPAAKEAASEEPSVSSYERVQVRVTPVPESTSEWRFIDLRVTVRGDCPTLDLTIRILEFLKRVQNVSLMSMEANTQMAESISFNHVNLRLRIEGNEWDQAAFQEAVKRVVADMAQ